MKIFLFLYPIREYIEREISDSPDDLLVLERLNTIINVRYRQSGYQIYWLLFSTERDSRKPEFSLLDPRIRIYDTDQVIPAGLSRERHRKHIYPSPKRILIQLGSYSELVIGGFHQCDCVNRIARAAYRNGVRVTVEEDATDQFFKTTRIYNLPPIMRNRDEYAVSFLLLLKNLEKQLPRKLVAQSIREHCAERRRKPWLVQI